MGSERLPGKIAADIEGIPLLSHVIRRTGQSRCVTHVAVATTRSPADDVTATIASSEGCTVVRGSEDDVLGRYVDAAEVLGADIVVRVTADCPVLDARLIDRVVRRLRDAKADYASNVEPPTYPDGLDVEAFTVGTLVRMNVDAQAGYLREHVTAVARENPGRYKSVSVQCRRDLSAYRLTVDLPADLERIRRIYAAMRPRTNFGLGALMELFTRHSDLVPITTDVRDEKYLAQRRLAEGGAR
jgi:spore coat polysaccharide biosynthesis protein SpsF (cytidylyltransferase family)